MVEVLFSDNHLLALNKPAELLTQPSGTDRDSLEAQGKLWVQKACNKPGNVFLHAAHRIDFPVSGIVLFARTSKALSRLNESIRNGHMHKTYLALVSPPPKAAEGQLEHYLLHGDHEALVVGKDTPRAQRARLRYRTIAKMDKVAMLEVLLETGRYHQIRAQLSAVGSPILNDTRYGGVVCPGVRGIGLHHHRLEIPHPVGGAPVVIVTPPPKDGVWSKALWSACD